MIKILRSKISAYLLIIAGILSWFKVLFRPFLCEDYIIEIVIALLLMLFYLIAAAYANKEKDYENRTERRIPPHCFIILAILGSVGEIYTAVNTLLYGNPYFIDPGCMTAITIELLFSIIALILGINAIVILEIKK